MMRLFLFSCLLVPCLALGNATFTIIPSNILSNPSVVTNDGNTFAKGYHLWNRDIGFRDFSGGSVSRRASSISEDGTKVSLTGGGLYWQNGVFQGGASNTYDMSADGRYIGGTIDEVAALWDGLTPNHFPQFYKVAALSPDGSVMALTAIAPGDRERLYRWRPGSSEPVSIGAAQSQLEVTGIANNGTIVGNFLDGFWRAFRAPNDSFDFFLGSASSQEALGISEGGEIIFCFSQGPQLWSSVGMYNIFTLIQDLDIPDTDLVEEVNAMSRNGRSFAGVYGPDFKSRSSYVLTLDSILTFARQNAYTKPEDQTLIVALASGVLVNDISFAGTTITAELVTPPEVGVLQLNPNGSFTYTPPLNFNGIVTFRYRATDGTETSSPVPVMLTISADNDAPTVAAPASFSGFTSQALPLPGISVGDVDLGNGTASLTVSAAYGSVTLGGVTGRTRTIAGSTSAINSALASVSYRSDGGFSGTDTLTIRINDQGNTGAGGPKETVRTTSLIISTMPPQAIFPTSSNPVLGFLLAGDVSLLRVSDNVRMIWMNHESGICEIEFAGPSPFEQISECRVGVEQSTSRGGQALEIQVYDYTASNWFISGFVATTFDSLYQVRVVQNPSRLIGPGGAMKARVRWQPINDEDPAADGWINSLDWLRWLLTP